MKPSISVIIPTHNRLDRLPDTIQSVLNQTFSDLELIIIDDGSTDDTSAYVHSLKDDRVIYSRQTQQGVSSARNNGIHLSRSPLIAFLDSDDHWHPDKLNRQITALKQSTARLIHCDEIWVRNGKRVNAMKKHTKRGGFIYEHCLPLCCVSPSAVIVEKSLILSLGGFDESLPACEDYDLWLRICSQEPVLFIEDALLTKFGGHEDQLSRRYVGMDRFRVQALEKMLCSAKLTPEQISSTQSMLVKKATIYAQGALKYGRVEESENYLALAAKYQSKLQIA